MELRFEGDLSVWQGVILAIVAAVLIVSLYKRETGKREDRMRWLLPALRMVAIVLVILMLTGPVLRGKVKVGDISRVLVFVDESQSMSLVDKTMPDARKILIAQRRGWLPKDIIHTGVYDAAQHLSNVANYVIDIEEIIEPLDVLDDANAEPVVKRLNETTDALHRDIHKAADNLKGSEHEKTFTDEIVKKIDELSPKKQLDVEVQRERAREVQELARAAAKWKTTLGDAFDTIVKKYAEGGNEEVKNALAKFDEMTRWQRIEAALFTDDNALLRELKGNHRVELLSMSGADDEEGARLLWTHSESDDKEEILKELKPGEPGGKATNLVEDIKHRLANHESDERVVAIMLTDGQHNSKKDKTGTPLQLAKVLGTRGVPMYPVGFGSQNPPRDLAVLAVKGPQQVFADDRVKGEILIKDNMPVGKALNIKIEIDGEEVWSERLTTTNSKRRSVEYDFPIKDLVKQRLARDVGRTEVLSMPLPMKVVIDPVDGELRDDNNDREMHVRAIMRRKRILLIDARPRWEYRYIRNLFDRDEKWEVNPIIVDTSGGEEWSSPRMPRGSRRGAFPRKREELFTYDVIVFGEVPRKTFKPTELQWLNQFVSSRGGGIVFLDGRRGKLRQYAKTPIEPLLPIEYTGAPGEHNEGFHPVKMSLTSNGRTVAALGFEATAAATAERWGQLPPPRWVAQVKALPGAEPLVNAVRGELTMPAMVIRRFGAGTVLYCGHDESWRWRYEVADRYHSRFWNQIANHVMEPPYAVHDKYVSIDTGGFTYEKGKSAQIRVRLRDERGQPVIDANTEALLYKDDELVATVPLTPDQNAGGVFRGDTASLKPGTYELGVKASGFTDDQLKARAAFAVLGEAAGEMNVLYCDEELLQQMARESGGEYVREEDIALLPAKLEPLSDQRDENRELLLWRTWWWFVPIVALFTCEWVARKKAGLM